MKYLEAHSAGVEIRGQWILREFSLRFQSGELAAVIGPNGAGKSTLLRVLAGLQNLSSGKVTLDGAELAAIPRSSLAREISFVPQNTYLPFAFTVREVVATGRNPHLGRFQRERREDRASIEDALAITDTRKFSNRFVTELSGGERQRVMIARSLATKAEIVLMDEPTSNLDPAHAMDILELCRAFARSGTLVILTTQDLNMAARYADRVVVMKSGSLMAAGPIDVVTDSALHSVFGVRGKWATTAEGERAMVFWR